MKHLNSFLCLFSSLFLTQFACGAAPASPTNGGASILYRDVMQITWQDNSDNEDFFAIYNYANDQVGNYLGGVAPDSTSARISGFSAGDSAQYAIFAYNEIDGHSTEYVVTPVVTFPTEMLAPEYITRYGHEATVGQPFSAELYTDVLELQTSAAVTGLPNGATFTEATRRLAFTPTEPGTFTLELAVTYSDGFIINASIPIRVIAAASVPVESQALPSLEYTANASVQTVDLNTYFEDPDTARAVRMTYGLGVVDVLLYEAATPATVANFLAYVNGSGAGAYDGSIIHRSMTNFVIQGGGYRPSGGTAFESVADLDPVVNEPGLENVRGTLSMAKLEGNPNSATSEWFVSLADNRANLDYQNGGFTVFGRVAGDGMNVIDAIAALPTGAYSDITVDSESNIGLLSNCPMNAAVAPATMEQDKLVSLLSAVEVAPLSYSIVSNSDVTVATTTIDDGSLQITPIAVGTSTVRVRVTDLDNNSIERDVAVVVGWSFADWIQAQGLTSYDGALDDADSDRISNLMEYALFGDVQSPNVSLSQQTQVSYGTPTEDDYLAVEFSTRNDVLDTIVYVEAIDELSVNSTWDAVWNSTQGALDSQVFSNTVSTEHSDWVIRDLQSMDASEQRFMRVRVQAVAE